MGIGLVISHSRTENKRRARTGRGGTGRRRGPRYRAWWGNPQGRLRRHGRRRAVFSASAAAAWVGGREARERKMKTSRSGTSNRGGAPGGGGDGWLGGPRGVGRERRQWGGEEGVESGGREGTTPLFWGRSRRREGKAGAPGAARLTPGGGKAEGFGER
jgi:hypothetical protein